MSTFHHGPLCWKLVVAAASVLTSSLTATKVAANQLQITVRGRFVVTGLVKSGTISSTLCLLRSIQHLSRGRTVTSMNPHGLAQFPMDKLLRRISTTLKVMAARAWI